MIYGFSGKTDNPVHTEIFIYIYIYIYIYMYTNTRQAHNVTIFVE